MAGNHPSETRDAEMRVERGERIARRVTDEFKERHAYHIKRTRAQEVHACMCVYACVMQQQQQQQT